MMTPVNLVCHELIGLKVEVASSSDETKCKMSGTVVDETRNMIIMETKHGRRSVAKKECVFNITTLAGECVRVDGDVLMARPEDRIKKLGRKMGCENDRRSNKEDRKRISKSCFRGISKC